MNIASKVLTAIARIWSAFWREGPPYFLNVCKNVVATVEGWLYDQKRALYGIAVARILFGLAALGLLLTNFNTRLYTYGSGAAWSGQLEEPISSFGKSGFFDFFFSIAKNDTSVTIFFLMMMVLAVTLIIGYRARILLPIFLWLWIGFIETPFFGSDQGDNAMRIAMFLMMFTDHSARWSLDARRRGRNADFSGNVFQKLWNGAHVLPAPLTALWHNLAIIALACQVFMIYVSGALFKSTGEPWQEGTAVYAPLHTMRFGPWPEISELITTMGWSVAIASIGSIILQVSFPGALLFRWTRIPVLFAMVSFHIGIAILMGLPWFSLAMVGVDAIFIRDVTWSRLANWFKKAAKDAPADVAAPEMKTVVGDKRNEELHEKVSV